MSAPTLTVLITGSNQGLGCPSPLNIHTIRVSVSGRNPALVQETVKKITKGDGCKAVVDSVVIDVTDDASIKAAVTEVEDKLQGAALDVLVVHLLPAIFHPHRNPNIACICRIMQI
jgi:NADP-dependent 3-hydroxy acid dehydrogenase YdfG